MENLPRIGSGPEISMEPGAGPQVSTYEISSGEPVKRLRRERSWQIEPSDTPYRFLTDSGARSPSARETRSVSAAASEASRPASTSRAWVRLAKASCEG